MDGIMHSYALTAREAFRAAGLRDEIKWDVAWTVPDDDGRQWLELSISLWLGNRGVRVSRRRERDVLLRERLEVLTSDIDILMEDFAYNVVHEIRGDI